MLTAAGGASFDSRWGVNLFFFFSLPLVPFCVVALGARDCAPVVNLQACGLAFEDTATNPVTLSEERSEREEKRRGRKRWRRRRRREAHKGQRRA